MAKYQIFTKLPQIPHNHINRNFLSIFATFLDQLLHPYKFHGRDMSGILFFIFASCEPLSGPNLLELCSFWPTLHASLFSNYDIGLFVLYILTEDKSTMNYNNNPWFSVNLFFYHTKCLKTILRRNCWQNYFSRYKTNDLDRKKEKEIWWQSFSSSSLSFSNWKCAKSRLAWNLNGYWFVFKIMKLLLLITWFNTIRVGFL